MNELARSCRGNDLAVWPRAATGRDLYIRCSRPLQLYYDGKTVTDHGNSLEPQRGHARLFVCPEEEAIP